jgi:hypothetical protein
MATVYLAHDLKHDRDVAVKVVHPDLGAALGGDRFLSEIRTTARLQHPHILPLLDSGSADGLLYYVMPYVAGETLRARLERERQLPIEDAVRMPPWTGHPPGRRTASTCISPAIAAAPWVSGVSRSTNGRDAQPGVQSPWQQAPMSRWICRTSRGTAGRSSSDRSSRG